MRPAPSSTSCSTCATASTASACARSVRRRRWRSQATSRSSATSSSRTSTKAAARSATRRRSTTCSPPSRCTRIPRSRRCPHDHGLPGRDMWSDQGYGTATAVTGVDRLTQPPSDLVTVTIDERTVQVPKGTGMVETAAAAGIEIPVFCYEPRLGAAVGACRMCLVEVEGIPKLQAGCTLSAQDGMIVRTARSSEKAAEGQNSTLEFILVNHPLDCPVCDKGGECPLQDLTFRYGPGNTRMTFPKRTFEKPIPISPTIALDRERCILCYRCTRFSESVAEDGQLVAINRGAQSVIATFEDEPYRAHFSGNVIELCPVGALTSTQYRFEARPWEIQNVPTVCGDCPVGCNTQVTTREGKAKRVLSRNHPEIDEGWLCDKGRFAYAHLNARDRITAPLRKAGPRRFEAVSWDEALDRAEELLRSGGAATVTALSGGESVEEAYGLAKLMRRGLGANAAVM